MKTNKREKALVLVVDDNPANITLISSHISVQGYDLAIATNGTKAIEIAKEYLPDIILLDVMMPGLDGFAVCKILKEDENTEAIPIVFLTAATSQNDVVKGFSLGAVDYITKPFNSAELQARLKTHIKLKQALEIIEEDKIKLEKLNEQKNEFLGIAAHDLKNPIYNITMLGKFLRDDTSLTREEIEEFSNDIVISSDKMLHIITDLLDVNAIENGKIKVISETTDLNVLVQEIFYTFKERADKKGISLNFIPSPDDDAIETDRRAILHIMDNLVSNSLKFTEPGKKVDISIIKSDDGAIIGVKDEGPGFSDEDKKQMFKRFQRLSAQPTGEEHSSGLGLSIVKRYVNLISAEIQLDEDYNDGAYFKLILPKKMKVEVEEIE